MNQHRSLDRRIWITYLIEFILDAEQLDAILVALPECRKVPVQEDIFTIQLHTNLSTCDRLVANLERDARVQVTADLSNLDSTEDRNLDLHNELDTPVRAVVVERELTRRQ